MATSREDRKKELLTQGVLLRKALALQVQTAVRGPNAVTKSVKLIKKIKSIGVKPFAIGGGVLGLLLLKPWRFFTKKKAPVPIPVPSKESLASKLVRYAKAMFPVARFIMGLGKSSKTEAPSSQVFAILLEKISGLLSKRAR